MSMESITPPEKRERIEDIADAILFDFDGVLYNSMENVARAIVEVCSRFGVETTMEYVAENFSQPWWKFYEDIGVIKNEEDKEKVLTVYKKIRSEQQTKDEIYPEAAATLLELSARNVQLGIVSTKEKEKIVKILQDCDSLDNLFDEKHIMGDHINKVAAIREFCTINNLSPERVLMVGDLPSDLQDGREAGTKVAAMARFAEAKQRLANEHPDFLWEDLGVSILSPKPFNKENDQ